MEENNVYNEFDINERNANEYEADPSVFFNKTGNPFVGFTETTHAMIANRIATMARMTIATNWV